MHVLVSKNPDGIAYMTKDGHGDLFDKEVTVGKRVTFGENTVALVPDPLEEDGFVVEFSWVDYLDTSNRERPGDGVRHTVQRPAPGRYDAGPYVVEVTVE